MIVLVCPLKMYPMQLAEKSDSFSLVKFDEMPWDWTPALDMECFESDSN